MGQSGALRWKYLVLGAVAIAALIAVAYGASEYYTSQSSFCGGSCHTMDEQNTAWKADAHHAANNPDGKQAECIECHMLPGEHGSFKEKARGLRHLAAYLYDPKNPLPIRPVVEDGACLRSGCHAKENFQDTEIEYIEGTTFKHKAHFEDKALVGQALTCDTCHVKVTVEKHFETPKEICFLCHFKPSPPGEDTATGGAASMQKVSLKQRPSLNPSEGATRCDLCHTIPTKSLQSQLTEGSLDKKPITHQTLQEAGVACESCHFDIVKGAGEIDTGNVVASGCLSCHNKSEELLTKAGDGKLMHDAHIATPRADCFDCHAVIEHKDRPDHLNLASADCTGCHEDSHTYEKLLLAGATVSDNVPATPSLMDAVNTNCMGCHLEQTHARGDTAMTGSAEACVACHTKEERNILKKWTDLLGNEVEAVAELEQEALAALEGAKGKIDAGTLAEAETLIAKGREITDIVRYGNGAHNKKYSIMILDEAFANFEDSIDLIDEEQ